MTGGNDGEEARKGKDGDMLMNQIHPVQTGFNMYCTSIHSTYTNKTYFDYSKRF